MLGRSIGNFNKGDPYQIILSDVGSIEGLAAANFVVTDRSKFSMAITAPTALVEKASMEESR